MYIPDAFHETDPEILKEFIGAYPFATVITHTESDLKISHVPMYFTEENGKGFLVGHLAKANDHWRFLGRKTTIIFHGPHAYVSSKWYETVNVVPTWNYVAVHVAGILSETDNAGLRFILDLMVQRHEGDVRAFQSGISDEVRLNLETHIIGVKMEIEKMEGKWKLSQNKSVETQGKIAKRLLETGSGNSKEVAALMDANIQRSKKAG